MTPSVTEIGLTREGLVKAFGLQPDLLAALEEAGILAPDAAGTFDLAGTAAALFNYGMAHARSANERLLAAASALNDTLPALQRLSELTDHAGLDGAARERVTAELASFFAVFSKALEQATRTLQAGD